jgi:hypothetical protein
LRELGGDESLVRLERLVRSAYRQHLAKAVHLDQIGNYTRRGSETDIGKCRDSEQRNECE